MTSVFVAILVAFSFDGSQSQVQSYPEPLKTKAECEKIQEQGEAMLKDNPQIGAYVLKCVEVKLPVAKEESKKK